MKKEILQILRENRDTFVSGQTLCETFGVSRQAVWKNMAALKECGYEIESVPKKGYRLLAEPDTLNAPDILSRLPENGICKKVECFERIDSTNTKAKQLAEQGEPEGTLIITQEQFAGRGRRGREWKAEKGSGIWMTLLLRPRIRPEKVTGVTLLAAMAVSKGIEEVTAVRPMIKWPNDIVMGKRKVCGILTEMSAELSSIHYLVVGIGINVNNREFPEEISQIASSVYLETGKKVNRNELAAAVIKHFGKYYELFMKEQDLSCVVEEYNAMLANKDKEVKIYYGMQETAEESSIDTGVARGIDKEGSLIVEIDGKEKKIVSGEVSVRGLYGYV